MPVSSNLLLLRIHLLSPQPRLCSLRDPVSVQARLLSVASWHKPMQLCNSNRTSGSLRWQQLRYSQCSCCYPKQGYTSTECKASLDYLCTLAICVYFVYVNRPMSLEPPQFAPSATPAWWPDGKGKTFTSSRGLLFLDGGMNVSAAGLSAL